MEQADEALFLVNPTKAIEVARSKNRDNLPIKEDWDTSCFPPKEVIPSF
jgi:hypothetical protein